MNILGIGFLSESSAALVVDGKLIAAISEERLNRRKLWYGFPEAAISEVLRIGKLKLSDIDYVTTHGYLPSKPKKKAFIKKKELVLKSKLENNEKKRIIKFLDQRYQHEIFVYEKRTPKILAIIKSLGRPLKIYGHHHCHAATAYYGSGWKNCDVITADGWGEDGSHTYYVGKDNKNYQDSLKVLSTSSTIDSLGYFYGSVTKALGFTPHKDEGKVLGLAAYCKNPKSYKIIRSMIDTDIINKNFIGKIEDGLYLPHFDNPKLISLISKFSRQDVSASTQLSLEDVMLKFIKSLGNKKRKIALSGGIFANVKLNQRIMELDNVEELYIFPNMGDGGLSVGSAWLAYHELTQKYPNSPKSMYLGNSISTKKSKELLKLSDLKFKEYASINSKIAELLAKGKIVARCSGRMEFGPRALGNRSILYNTSDTTVNQWLNKKLKRSDFMPFAPITKKENAKELYSNLDKISVSSKFMTVTTNCSDSMLADSPAAVHVDNTARPQIVTKDTAPDVYDILCKYEEISGKKSLINTSFNMHEEPIVCDEQDAIRAFIDGQLDYLVLNNLLIEKPVKK